MPVFRHPYHFVISEISASKVFPMMRKQKTMRGSVLVFTLLVLTILLSVALTSAGVVIVGKNSSRSTEKSALAFQIADGAAENILKRVYKDTDSNLSQLANNLYTSSGNVPNCQTGGVITGALPGASGTYSATLLDVSGNPMQCSGTGYDTYSAWRGKLAHIVASGSYGGATRAIDVSVEPPSCNSGITVDDADGNTYDTVKIGTQCWMKQNMRVGTMIGAGSSQGNDGVIKKYCFNNSASNCTNPDPTEPDGGLYVWDEAMQYVTTESAQGICPSGWHIPTDAEWYTLENFIDPTINNPNATGLRGTDAGTKMKTGGSSGFEANMTGYWDTIFSSKTNARFWSSSETGGSAWGRDLQSASVQVTRTSFFKGMALLVRCIQD